MACVLMAQRAVAADGAYAAPPVVVGVAIPGWGQGGYDQSLGRSSIRERGTPVEQGSTPAVRIEGLWKQFGQQVAVAGVDLELPAGQFIGLVGPNGAGKTTTLSMVTGL